MGAHVRDGKEAGMMERARASRGQGSKPSCGHSTFEVPRGGPAHGKLSIGVWMKGRVRLVTVFSVAAVSEAPRS